MYFCCRATRVGRRDPDLEHAVRTELHEAHDPQIDEGCSGGSSGSSSRRERAPRRSDACMRRQRSRRVGASAGAALTSAPPDRRAADTASRRAGSPGARCARRACRTRLCGRSRGRSSVASVRISSIRFDHAARTSASRGAMPRPPSRRSSSSSSNNSTVYGHSRSSAACTRARLSAVPSPSRTSQLAAVAQVVARLLHGFRGDRRQALIARARQALVELELKRVDQHLAHDGFAEVAVRLLREGRDSSTRRARAKRRDRLRRGRGPRSPRHR